MTASFNFVTSIEAEILVIISVLSYRGKLIKNAFLNKLFFIFLKITKMNFEIRFATSEDAAHLIVLYKLVAKTIGGIAREEIEITEDYISNFLRKSLDNGLCMIIENPQKDNEIIAEIHCYKLDPKVFNHVLSELTIVVHPNFQNQGLGKMLFTKLLENIKENRTDILRVELIARESNITAIKFYQKIGFLIEGRFENRISNHGNGFEADIPMAWFNPYYKKST